MTTPPNAPPPSGGYGAPAPNVNNYLVQSILVTLFCCLPFGIVAIINSSKVSGLLAQGDYAGAQAAADSAKKWSMYGLIAGIVVGVLYVLFVVLFGAASFSAGTT